VPLQCYPANGVPWLVWLDRQSWRCEGCGRAGQLPPYTTVASFAKALGDLKRVHHGCGPVRPGAGDRVGDPLNPHRAER